MAKMCYCAKICPEKYCYWLLQKYGPKTIAIPQGIFKNKSIAICVAILEKNIAILTTLTFTMIKGHNFISTKAEESTRGKCLLI